MTHVTYYIKKVAIICNILLIMSFASSNVNAGWFDWACTSCNKKLEQAEKDKMWLWERLVECRANVAPKPFPQPSRFQMLPGAAVTAIMDEWTTNIYKADANYRIIPKDEFEAWLRYNPISEITYSYEDFDCDDFAQQVVAAAKMWFPQLAIAEVWAHKVEGSSAHAFIVHIDIDHNATFYEPQSDGQFYQLDEKWDPYFMKFDVKETTK